MGRYFVIFWLVVVIGSIAGMQAALFGTKGLPRPVRNLFGSAPSAHVQPAAAAPVASGNDTKAAAAQPAPAVGGAKMVQPESLEQGFMVVVTDKTRVANASSPIHMPNSHNGWNPADPKVQLSAQSDMRWRIVFEKPTLDSRIAFKFARGSWENVESTADFKDIDNRMLPMVDVSNLKPGEKPVIELEIVAWKDQAPGGAAASADNRYRTITVGAGRLERLEVVGGGGPGLAGLSRDLLVWLPPGYDAQENRTRTYPVLYMADGQNLFQKHAGIPAEWGVDETAARLIDEKRIEPVIIVGIPHAGAKRSQEYLPIAAAGVKTPGAADFVAFLTGEAMPRVERAFRVKTGPQHTAIGGASLGAVIAMEAATARPDLFGKVLLESMPLAGEMKPLFAHFAQRKTWPTRMYMGMGGKEIPADAAASSQWAAGAQAFKELAAGKGLTEANFKFVLEPDAVHNEEAWAKRFGAAMEFLFPVGK